MVQGLHSENRCEHKRKFGDTKEWQIYVRAKMLTNSDLFKEPGSSQLPPLFSMPLLFYSTNTEMLPAS